jgi:DNA polymerase-3 subunit alpha
MESLIQCGAFDFAGVPRAKLFFSIDEVMRHCGAAQDPNQLNMFSARQDDDTSAYGLPQLPDCEEWDEKEKLRKEKESLGFYITGHPLDRFKSEVARLATSTIQDLGSLTDKKTVSVAGVIAELKIKRTKRGDKMAILTVEDQTGSTEVIVFPDVFSRYSPFLKSDEPLLFTGVAEVDDNNVKIISQEIIPLEKVREKVVRAIELALRSDWISKDHLEEIKDVFFRYPGDSSVFFRIPTVSDKEIVIAAHPRYRVMPCSELIKEIEGMIGQKVIYKYGEKNTNHRYSERA